jgi:hypothetical protein
MVPRPERVRSMQPAIQVDAFHATPDAMAQPLPALMPVEAPVC